MKLSILIYASWVFSHLGCSLHRCQILWKGTLFHQLLSPHLLWILCGRETYVEPVFLLLWWVWKWRYLPPWVHWHYRNFSTLVWCNFFHIVFVLKLKSMNLPFSFIRTISPHLVSRPFALTKLFGRFWKFNTIKSNSTFTEHWKGYGSAMLSSDSLGVIGKKEREWWNATRCKQSEHEQHRNSHPASRR